MLSWKRNFRASPLREMGMTESARNPHKSNVIRLVADAAATLNRSSRRPIGKPEQLALALDGQRMVVFVATDKIHGATFLRTLSKLRPSLLLDLRFAPHFEFTAVPTNIIKHGIDHTGSPYLLHSLPFHELRSNLLRHEPAELADKLLLTTCGPNPIRGPLMVLVQHRQDAEAFGPYLVGALQRAEGGHWQIEIVE